MSARKTLSIGSALVFALGAATACRSSESKTTAAEIPDSPAAIDAGELLPPSEATKAPPMPQPLPREQVEAVLNPRKLPAYEGPVGWVEGTVRIKGAEAPKTEVAIPTGCGDALAGYSKLFREGTGRTLADALVTVTEYEGYLPSRREAKPVAIRGCAFDTRTVALTFGERLDIQNRDTKMSYLPKLIGARHPVEMVAVPKGDPVKLYPTDVGHYVLGDGMNRNWMRADVFVLKYPTHDVTGLDGSFRVEGIPVGKARVTAYLPAIDKSVDAEIEVKEGEATLVDLLIPYELDRETTQKAERPQKAQKPKPE